MNDKDFSRFIEKLSDLSGAQVEDCLKRLKGGHSDNGKADVPAVIAEARPDGCPHCGHDKLIKWGSANNLPRWRCKDCGRTFNVLTKTPLARLRKKEKWGAHAKAMMDGRTIRKTAQDCGVHRNTAFLWRHRFLKWQQSAQATGLTGIAECDATFFFAAKKGNATLTESLARGAAMA